MRALGMLCMDEDRGSVDIPKNVWGYGDTAQAAICETLTALGYAAHPVNTNPTDAVVDYLGHEYVYICDEGGD